MLLEDKKLFITGASSGLGKSIALEAAKEGASIAFTYSKNEQKALQLLDELNALNSKGIHLSYKLNCENLNDNLETAKKLKEKWDSIDILINNAGVSDFIPLALMDESDWDHLSNINSKGVYATTKAFLPFMIRQKSGAILNISSLAGVRILAAPIHYCATKASVKGFTESLAKEIGRYNIRVNCLAPGILEGGVANGIPDNKLENYKKQISLGRIGTFEECAKCAIFMVSDKNSYMSGHTLIIEGGL